MKVDVSEIKEFRHCKRKWKMSSRNSFHLRPIVPQPALKMGTVFHESLHKLYAGRSLQDVEEYIGNEMNGSDEEKNRVMLLSMVRGYTEEVLSKDLERYTVLEIEHHFNVKPLEILDARHRQEMFRNPQWVGLEDTELVGSIDMIVLDRETNAIWGFEHKTAKNFRNDVYLWMDEQPRVYTAALQKFVAEYNERRYQQWVDVGMPADHAPVEAKLGGIYINEVRKLVRSFDYKRSTLLYAYGDLQNFLLSFVTSVAECHRHVKDPTAIALPQPDMFACQMCAYNHICQAVQYSDISLESILDIFRDEYVVREQDHLEDKQETAVKEER